MPSRRDQLVSHQFMMQRVVSAFAYRDADAARVPFPRAASTFFIGTMVAVLALAAVGIYGVLFPGGKKTWRSGEVLILEKETGARYVYLDDKLHPVLNYTSARLILKRQSFSVVSVARTSLRGAARGEPLGIVDAPDSLPESKRLRRDGWSLCSRPVTTATGNSLPAAVLHVASDTRPGRDVGDEALLVRHPDNSLHLVWQSRRFLIRQPQMVLSALALTPTQAIPVAASFLNALPQGADIGPIAIAGRGGRSALPDARVGQVVATRSQSGDLQYSVVLRDGIADITQLQADLIINDPATATAYRGKKVEPLIRNDLGAARRSPRGLETSTGQEGHPQRRPRIVEGPAARNSLCLVFGDITTPTRLVVGAALPRPGAGVRSAQSGTSATPDEIVVPSGDGILVESVSGPEAPTGTFALVTDMGVRYSLASSEVIGYLGYRPDQAKRLPSTLVAMLREGPALDPKQARTPGGPT
ncbi:type VII secretion protein EccB [Micromonospora sp. DT31]|uniref:type VII secretion protein EccB n=1 Tax=Micromonospora sp. DT31 TaxID=3393434 RepID=UPI003CE68F75